jgi:hypothetical protein
MEDETALAVADLIEPALAGVAVVGVVGVVDEGGKLIRGAAALEDAWSAAALCVP